MNRRKAIFFLLLAAFCFVGSLPLFWLQMKSARHQMKERMEAMVDDSELQILDFDLLNGEVAHSDFAMLRPDKEFSYQGHRYDIFKSEIKGQHIRYWVLADELEDALLANLQVETRTDNPIQTATKSFLKFFGKSFPHPQIDQTHAALTHFGYGLPQSPFPTLPFREVSSPPPQA